MEKDIRNVDAVGCKLGPALTRPTNQRLEVAKEEKRKKEKMVEKRKIKAMTAKCQRARGEISLSSGEEKNYESDTGDESDPDQGVDNKYLL